MNRLLATAITICAILAASAAGMQATGNWLAKRVPALASQLSSSPVPPTTLTLMSIKGSKDATSLADLDLSGALVPANDALERSLLSPAPLAVLAWNAPAVRQSAILTAASAVSRRNPLLNSALIYHYDSTGQNALLLDRINDLVTVKPSIGSQITPTLVALLEDESLLPTFTRLLELSPPWSEAFFLAASREPKVAANLVQLRLDLPKEAALSPEADREIIANLAATKRYGEALALFREFKPDARQASDEKTINWTTAYPPFDWALTDSFDIYARPRDDGELMVRIRPGHGGVLASRLIDLPRSTRGIRVNHAIEPSSQAKDMEIAVACAQSGEVLGSSSFAASDFTLPLVARPDGCDAATITISGRAWTTGQYLEGPISGLEIVTK